MKKKTLWIIILFSIIMICLVINKLYFSQLEPIKVSKDRQFTIAFNSPIIWDDTTKESIMVQDKDKNSVNSYIFLSANKKTLIINPPVHGYTPGETYLITVSPKIHIENYKLKSKKLIKFEVTNDKPFSPIKETRQAKYGDIIGVSGEFMGYKYEHYGIYVGNNKVIHYFSTTGKAQDTVIAETNMSPYFKNNEYFVLNLGNSVKFDPDNTVKRAKERLGERSYDLLQNNCEHFAVWCKTDESKSYQIEALSANELNQVKQLIYLGVNLQ